MNGKTYSASDVILTIGGVRIEGFAEGSTYTMASRKLPKLYRPVKIRFWSLRNKVGAGLGMIFDCDEQVERTARRVRTGAGWKWQIKDLAVLMDWDPAAEQDQEILNEYNEIIEWRPASEKRNTDTS